METDARGQLGGLDSPEAVRRRLAMESGNFKCPACAKTNADIIKECEERASHASSPSQEVEIPKDLNMGWRDEMEARKAKSADDAQESAELAEGFVQTGPAPSRNIPNPPTPNPSTPMRPHEPAVRPPIPAPIVPPAAHQLQRVQNGGVPLWIDRAIVGLLILLAAVVLKVFLGA